MQDISLTLPDDFSNAYSTEASVYFYQTHQSSKNNRIVFKQNVISFLVEGQKEVFSSNQKLSVNNDNILLIQAGNILMTEKTTNNNKYISVLFFFSDMFVFDFIEKISKKPITTKHKNEVTIISKDAFVSHFEQSLFLLQNSLHTNMGLTVTKLEEIVFYLYEQYPVELNNFLQNITQGNRDKPFTEIIKKHSTNNLSIQELAFLCNMSISTFKRKFKEVYNITPKQFFITERMNKAVSYLKKNKKPSEVYHELGYENLSAFSNEFKKHFGVSPKKGYELNI